MIDRVMELPSKPGGAVLIFSDHSFVVAGPVAIDPRELKEGVSVARTALESKYPEAFAEYDRLDHIDKEAGRLARLENILGAIQNNLDHIPELKDRIRSLVRGWET